MDSSITEVATLRQKVIVWLDDLLPGNIPKVPRKTDPGIVVVSNRIMEIPKLAYSNLYLFLATRVAMDTLRGVELLVCRGSEELARTLISIIQTNEHGLTKGFASLLANCAAQAQYNEDTWVLQVEPDEPRAWLRGWFLLSKITTETQKQLKFLMDAERQLKLEVGIQGDCNA